MFWVYTLLIILQHGKSPQVMQTTHIVGDVKYMDKQTFIANLLRGGVRPGPTYTRPADVSPPKPTAKGGTIDQNSLYMTPGLTGNDQFKIPKPAEITVYNPSPNQTDSRPREMASGRDIYEGAIASGNRDIALGSKVYIPELQKQFTVEDRMNKRYHKPGQMDYFDIPTMEATKTDTMKAKNFGRQKLSYVLLDN